MSKIQDFVSAYNAGAQAKLDAYIAKQNQYKTARATAITLTLPKLSTWPPDKSVVTTGDLFKYVYSDPEGSKEILPSFDDPNYPDVIKELKDVTTGAGPLYTTLHSTYRAVYGIHEMNSKKPFDGQKWFDRFMFDVLQSGIREKNKVFATFEGFQDHLYKITKLFSDNYYAKSSDIDLYTTEEKLYDAFIEAGYDYKLPVPSASAIVSKTTGTQSGTQSTPVDKLYITVKDPKSDGDKKITGTITFDDEDGKIKAKTKLEGLPSPWTNPINKRTINGKYAFYDTDYLPLTREIVADYAIYGVQSFVDYAYGFPITLQYTDKAPDIIPPVIEAQSATSSTATASTATASTATSSTATIGTQSTFDATGIKVTLRKKSGPGELIGEVDKIIKNGFVDFSGIQFDMPGDYVISVITDSNLIENNEVTITVLPEDEVIAQDKSRGDDKDSAKVEGTRPIIAQITKPTIVLKPIEFDTSKNNSYDKEIATGLGLTPFVWYNGYQINERDIKSLDLWYEGLVPNARLVFADSIGFMKKEGFPLDDTKFEIFLNSGSKNLKSIHLKFKLSKFHENKNSSYEVVGTLDLRDFYKVQFAAYQGTSFEVLKHISTDLAIGFNSNITNTSDSMTWRNIGKFPKEFINEIIKHSYISDTSYVLGYIDYYYCFNYVDIEKEWLRDISKDVGLASTGTNHLNEPSTRDKIERLQLTNDKGMQTSPFYFSSYRLINQSTNISVKKGHFTVSKAYDKKKKQFVVFDVHSQSSDGSKTIILKGAPGDAQDIKENFITNYGGKIDTENTHIHYLYSEVQNQVNLDNMVRIAVDLELPHANFNLYKFMKIQLNFINQKNTVTTQEVSESRLTGEWVIIDIGYKWTKGSLKQTVKAVKKELGKTQEEIKKDAVTNQQAKQPETNTQNNENPVVPQQEQPIMSTAIPPNSVYKVGEIYLVQNTSGKQFKLVITEVLENGKDVKATIKNI
jgi:hypothetical protein